jgi:1-acyl-sn-glycerol-3-phosphate acyltransferase
MNWTWYRTGRAVTRFIMFCTMRVRKLRPEIPDSLAGGYVLAVTHQGHLDPFIASSLQNRPVIWMTRKEFFRPVWARVAITKLNGFCVDRHGVSVSAIRYAIARAREGYAIGICPEGAVVCGADACFRGGRIKRGLASVSIHAQVPVVPCLIIGTARLNNVPIWLPAKWARIWVGYGSPIQPPPGKSTRQTRELLARQIESAYVNLYKEMSEQLAVDPRWAA